MHDLAGTRWVLSVERAAREEGGRCTSGVGNHAMPKEGWYKDDVAGVCHSVDPWQVGVRIRGDVDPLVLFPSLNSMRCSEDSVRRQKAPSLLAPNYHTEDVLRRCAGCSQKYCWHARVQSQHMCMRTHV